MTEPTEHRTPGQLLQDLLVARGWSQRVLAVVLGVGETVVNKLASDIRPVDAEMALKLGELFAVPPERFMQLQLALDLDRARLVARPDPGRTTRAIIFGGLPIASMIERGWLQADGVRDVAGVETAVTKFFGATSLGQVEILPHAARKTAATTGEIPAAQLAWLYRVKTIVGDMMAPRYTTDAALDAARQLKLLLHAPEEARKVPRILAECGIRFAIVETLPGAKIDGVTFWLNEHSPVIAMTLRHDRIDNFWFVLRHELEHVLRGDGRAAVMLDTELEGARAGVGQDVAEEERLANEAAAEFCIPQKALAGFIARKAPFFNQRDIIGFARVRKVHPGIVAGQLQHKTGRYDRFRDFQARIRSFVTPSAMVDGWGDVAPTD